MKEFVKYTLATICGIVLVHLFAFLLFIMMAGTLSVIGSDGTSIEDHSILRLRLSGTLTEQGQPSSPFDELLGKANMESQGLDQMIQAIRLAKTNDKIEGIYLDGGSLAGDMASMQYLRSELQDFKKSGKWIYAYADQYAQSSYYVASVADSIMLNPLGMIDWHGIASQPIFYTGLLEKLGVKDQAASPKLLPDYTRKF